MSEKLTPDAPAQLRALLLQRSLAEHPTVETAVAAARSAWDFVVGVPPRLVEVASAPARRALPAPRRAKKRQVRARKVPAKTVEKTGGGGGAWQLGGRPR